MIQTPEAPGEQQQNRVDFQSSGDHQEGQKKLREAVKHAEISAASRCAERHAGVGEDAERRRNRRFQIEIVP